MCDANILGVLLGGGLFGVGMVLYGYCPGTGLAVVATESLHAVFSVMAGAILYANPFDWVRSQILST